MAASFGKRLKEARIEAGLRQTELAEAVGIDASEISRWEAGDRTKNHERFLRRLQKAAAVLETDPAHLAFGDEPGEVNVLEADLDTDPVSGATSPFDAHSMDPVAVLNSVRALGVDPPRTLVVGCKPACLEGGIGLSPVVASAVEPATRVVLELIERESTTKEC